MLQFFTVFQFVPSHFFHLKRIGHKRMYETKIMWGERKVLWMMLNKFFSEEAVSIGGFSEKYQFSCHRPGLTENWLNMKYYFFNNILECNLL